MVYSFFVDDTNARPAIDRELALAVLSSGGHLLRHWIPRDEQPAGPPFTPPHRFTLHTHDSDTGRAVDRTIVRDLYCEGLIALGKMIDTWDKPRKLVITGTGIDLAVQRATEAYQIVIDSEGAQGLSLSVRQREIMRGLYDGGPDARVEQREIHGWHLVEDPGWASSQPLLPFDVEPLVGIGFLHTDHPDSRPVLWKMSQAAVDWAWNNLICLD